MQEQSIFIEALEKVDRAERAAFLDKACGDDPSLRQRIEKLLERHQQASSVLQPPDADFYATMEGSQLAEAPGTIIGPYKLLQQIGEGGMGTVYMAEQTEPVHRRVALKIIKPGMDSRQIITRFEAERQALALMDHPNIARVFEAGTIGSEPRTSVSGSPQTPQPLTDVRGSGRPYFVMELVKGVSITKYCDEHHLTPRRRLELFVPVCQAVQHAHQKGIIHRDLKPSNVLVAEYDDKPVVKVIDFGVAKATGPKLTDRTMFTEFGQVLGTLEYMSPEQAKFNALDIDTRSDIYALGVLLYELLTGTTPFEKKRLHEAAFDEMLRIIREEEPPKPSTRLTKTEKLPSVAANRGSEPRKLSGLVRGELDWIVMKALEKDRNRRYETANGLAMDVQRYLADEPVLACPPSPGYRLRKFGRKYKTLLRVAAAVVVLLAVAAVVSTWQAVRATLAERQALAERDRAEASFRMARDAVDQLFTQVSQSPNLKARGMEQFRKDLLRSAKGFHERFIQEHFDVPEVRYDLGLAHIRLAEIERELGDYAAAEDSLARAVQLFSDLVETHPDKAEYERELGASYFALGLVHFDDAREEKAEASFERALAIQEKQAATYPQAAEYRFALAKTYREWGFMHHRLQRTERAAKRYQQALAILGKLVQDYPVPEHQSLLAMTQMNLATVYNTKGLFDKAEPPLKEAKRIYEEFVRDKPDALPEHCQALARSQAILGMAYRGQAQTEQAEKEQQQAVEIFEKLAKDHPGVQEYVYDVGRCYAELGLTANRAGRPNDAVAHYDKSIAILEGVFIGGLRAVRNPLLNIRIDRATAQAARGDHAQATAEAEALARQGELRSGHLYDLACAYSQASAAAERDSKLAPEEKARLNARYANRAMEFLQRAVADGYRYPQMLKTDPDVEPLRTREDFQKLLADLEANMKD
jgi:serine/threonine protein kinase/tetratricopeptide (TPR) repeat protein